MPASTIRQKPKGSRKDGLQVEGFKVQVLGFRVFRVKVKGLGFRP